MITPYVIKNSEEHLIQSDVRSELLAQRIVYFGDEVNSETCGIAIQCLLYLAGQSMDKITLVISSPGGECYSGSGLLDTIELVKAKGITVETICTGLAASYGAVLLSAGSKGHRYCLPHSTVMVHQPSSGAKGKISDIEIDYHEGERLKKQLTQILATNCGVTYKKMEQLCDRDTWLSAEDAKQLGIIDDIMTTLK